MRTSLWRLVWGRLHQQQVVEAGRRKMLMVKAKAQLNQTSASQR
jgi:hypothetical protein